MPGTKIDGIKLNLEPVSSLQFFLRSETFILLAYYIRMRVCSGIMSNVPILSTIPAFPIQLAHLGVLNSRSAHEIYGQMT